MLDTDLDKISENEVINFSSMRTYNDNLNNYFETGANVKYFS